LIKTFWAWLELRDGEMTLTDNGEHVEVLPETVSAIQQKSKIAGSFISKHIYYEMLMRNLYEVLDAIEEYNKAEAEFTNNADYVPYLNDTNRLLVNALVSVNTYLEHYAKTVDLNGDIERLATKYFDANSLYRFVYKLRN